MADKGKDLSALYHTERKRLERQISRKVGCRSTASDLVQDIFLRLWEKAVEWKGDSAAYLSRCASIAAIDHLRAENTRAEYLDKPCTIILPMCGSKKRRTTKVRVRKDVFYRFRSVSSHLI